MTDSAPDTSGRPSNAASRPLRLLVTAGPTQEPIDAVRFIGNRSSGRMGIAIAEAAAARGHAVTLLLGPVTNGPRDAHDSPVRVRRFRTTDDLAALLEEAWPGSDVLVMAAAVADYRPLEVRAAAKLPRHPGGLTLRLEPTPDLLATLAAASRPEQRLVGFALEEPDALEARARAKLERKGIHAIVANPLRTMDAETVDALLLRASGPPLRPGPGSLSKPAFASWLVARIEELAAEPAGG